MVSFDTTVRQMTEISQKKMTEKSQQKKTDSETHKSNNLRKSRLSSSVMHSNQSRHGLLVGRREVLSHSGSHCT